ncbi:MAG: GWxTD domain-containing protein, partial [bacterium]
MIEGSCIAVWHISDTPRERLRAFAKMKFMTDIILAFWAFFLFAPSSPASSIQNQRLLQFNLDYASFKHEYRNLYVEIYYSFSLRQFEFVEQDSNKVAMFNIEAKIFQQDTLKFSQSWSGRSVIPGEETLERDKEWFTLTTLTLPPGNYRLVTKLKDVNSASEGVKEVDLELSAFPEERLCLSDIELANSIVEDTVGGLFTKNRYRVIPNPSVLYGLERPMLYFYSEIYNLSKSAYKVDYTILDSQRNAFRTYPTKIRKKSGTALVEVGGVNVVTLPTGRYLLELKVTDLGNSSQASQRKKFYIYRPEKTVQTLPKIRAEEKDNPLIEFYKSLSQETIDEEFETATYIAATKEKKIFKTLDLDGKREFIARFWWKRDTNSETAKNEFREDYLARVSFANEYFG